MLMLVIRDMALALGAGLLANLRARFPVRNLGIIKVAGGCGQACPEAGSDPLAKRRCGKTGDLSPWHLPWRRCGILSTSAFHRLLFTEGETEAQGGSGLPESPPHWPLAVF